MSNSVTPWTEACQASMFLSISQNSPKFISIESVILSNHLIFCHPLLLLPSIFPTIRVFFNESALHIRWPMYWSFSIGFSNDYSVLISLRIDWFDLLAVQGTLKSLPSTTIWKQQFFGAQHLYGATLTLYMATGKTIAFTTWIFVGKVMALF